MKKKKILSLLVMLIAAVTGAWAETYTGPVNQSAIQEGDILAPGFSINIDCSENSYFNFAASRCKKDGVLVTDASNNYSIKYHNFDSTNDNATINTIYSSATTYSFTPVDENGEDGNAWIVTYVAISGNYVDITVAGIKYENPAPASTYTIALADGTDDAANWTISPETAAEGATVTVTYSGQKRVKSVKAVKKEAPAAPTGLASLKAFINAGSDASEYIGYEVNAEGDIAESGVSGTKIGYVAYVSTTDADAGVSGSRILVIAAADVEGNKKTWGPYTGAQRNTTSDSGYDNTNTLQAFGSSVHPAAYACWNYPAARPEGASEWFLPSIAQLQNMSAAFGGYNTFYDRVGLTKVGKNTQDYWSSNEASEKWAYGLKWNGSNNTYDKNYSYYVRAVLAF